MASIKFELLGTFLSWELRESLMLDLPRNIAAHVKIFIGIFIAVDDYQDVSSTQHYF